MKILGPAGKLGEIIHVGHPKHDETEGVCSTEIIFIDNQGSPLRASLSHDTVLKEKLKVGSIIPTEVLGNPSKWP